MVRAEGRDFKAEDIAAFTSCAAPSISRSRSNCNVMRVDPEVLTEFIEVIPAIVENCFSKGSATLDAIVSGLAPGKLAETWIVGNSISGKALTGSFLYPISPPIIMDTAKRVVSTGRLTKNSEMFITYL